MSKIYLIFLPPANAAGYTQVDDYTKREHLGLAYMHSYLSKNGHDVSIIDADYFNIEVNDVVTYVAEPLLVGFSVFDINLINSIEVAKNIKQRYPKSQIIFGGIFCSFHWNELLSSLKCIDFVCVGEGEQVIVDLATAINNGKDVTRIPGLAFREKGVPKLNVQPSNIAIDTLPFPYRSYYYSNKKTRPLVPSIISGRGCYANCSFCLSSVYYRKYAGSAIKQRSVASVIQEMKELKNKWGYDVMVFTDLNFITPNKNGKNRLKRFATQLIEEEVSIKYAFTCRANDIVECEELLPLLKMSGFIACTFAVESTNDRQLKVFNKGYSKETPIKAIQILNNSGIDYKLYNITFDADATISEIIDSLKWIQNIGPERYYRVFTKLGLRVGTRLLDDYIDAGMQMFWSDAYSADVSALAIKEYDYDFKNSFVGKIYRLGYKLERQSEIALESLSKIDYESLGLSRLLYYEFEKTVKRHVIDSAIDIFDNFNTKDFDESERTLEHIAFALNEDILFLTNSLLCLRNGKQDVIPFKLAGRNLAILVEPRLMVEFDQEYYDVVLYLYGNMNSALENFEGITVSNIRDEITSLLNTPSRINSENVLVHEAMSVLCNP